MPEFFDEDGQQVRPLLEPYNYLALTHNQDADRFRVQGDFRVSCGYGDTHWVYVNPVADIRVPDGYRDSLEEIAEYCVDYYIEGYWSDPCDDEPDECQDECCNPTPTPDVEEDGGVCLICMHVYDEDKNRDISHDERCNR